MIFYTPSCKAELVGWQVGEERDGQVIGYRSVRPFRVLRPMTQLATRSVGAFGYAIPFLIDHGRELGSCVVPDAGSFGQAIAAMGRQLVSGSEDETYVEDFVYISTKYAEEIVQQCKSMLRGDQCYGVFGWDQFLECNPQKSEEFLANIWAGYQEWLAGYTPRRWKNFKSFVKLECSFKGSLPGSTKPRAIVVMSDAAYVFACTFKYVQDLLYRCPAFKQWAVKGMSNEEISEVVNEISREEATASTDFSGFENALDQRMRTCERIVTTEMLKAMGFHSQAEEVADMMFSEREVRTPWVSYFLNVRCSGDYWTSAGNGLVNVSITLTGLWIKMGRPEWPDFWERVRHYKFCTEGDDGLIPLSLLNPEVIRGLRMKFSQCGVADRPGGADFLKMTRWPVYTARGHYAGVLGNTFRWVRSLTWVRGAPLRASKVRFLWRAKALSLLYLAPHHPIINVLCKRIGKLTAGVSPFHGWQNHLKMWGVDWAKIPCPSKPFPDGPDFEVEPQMYTVLAESPCAEIPPIPVAEQLIAEAFFEQWDGLTPFEIIPAWRNYPEYQASLVQNLYETQNDIGDFTSPVVRSFWERLTR